MPEYRDPQNLPRQDDDYHNSDLYVKILYLPVICLPPLFGASGTPHLIFPQSDGEEARDSSPLLADTRNIPRGLNSYVCPLHATPYGMMALSATFIRG